MKIRRNLALFLAVLFTSGAVQAEPSPATPPKEINPAVEVLRQAKETSMAIKDEGVDKEKILRQIAEAQAEAGDVNAAISTVLKNPAYHSILLCKVAVAQAIRGDMAGSARTFDKISILSDRVRALYGVAKVLAVRGERKEAFKKFDEAAEEAGKAVKKSEKVELLKEVARAQTQIGEWSAAFQTVETLPDPVEKSRLLAKMAKNEAENGNFTGAFHIADIIEDPGQNALAHYNIASAQARKGDTPSARKTAAAILDDFYRASAARVIGEVLVKEKKTSEATFLFQEAKRLAKASRGELFDRAMLLKDLGLSQWQAGDTAAATDSFQEARRAALSIKKEDFYNQELALLAIAEALSQIGDNQAAQEVMQLANQATMKLEADPYNRAQVLLAIAHSEISIGSTEAAILVLQQTNQIAIEIPNLNDRCLILTDVAEALSSAGDFQGGLDALQKARRYSSQIKDEVDQLLIFINITLTYIRLGRPQEALKIAVEAPTDNQRGDLLGRVMTARVEDGEVDEALEIARDQNSAYLKTSALLGVARGILNSRRSRPAAEKEKV